MNFTTIKPLKHRFMNKIAPSKIISSHCTSVLQSNGSSQLFRRKEKEKDDYYEEEEQQEV